MKHDSELPGPKTLAALGSALEAMKTAKLEARRLNRAGPTAVRG